MRVQSWVKLFISSEEGPEFPRTKRNGKRAFIGFLLFLLCLWNLLYFLQFSECKNYPFLYKSCQSYSTHHMEFMFYNVVLLIVEIFSLPMMSGKLLENKHVTFRMKKEIKHVGFWMKTLNSWGVSWIHKVIGFWNPLERNRQSLYFINLKNRIALTAIICLNSKRNPRAAMKMPKNPNPH